MASKKTPPKAPAKKAPPKAPAKPKSSSKKSSSKKTSTKKDADFYINQLKTAQNDPARALARAMGGVMPSPKQQKTARKIVNGTASKSAAQKPTTQKPTTPTNPSTPKPTPGPSTGPGSVPAHLADIPAAQASLLADNDGAPIFGGTSLAINGQQMGAIDYNPETGQYETSINMTEGEKERQAFSDEQLTSLLKALTVTAPETQQRIQQMQDAYVNEQTAAFNRQYEPQLRNLREDTANRFGTLQATPFMDRMEQMEQNIRVPAMQSIQNQAWMLGQDMLDRDESRKQNQLNTLGYFLSEPQQRYLDALQLPMQANQNWNNFRQNIFGARTDRDIKNRGMDVTQSIANADRKSNERINQWRNKTELEAAKLRTQLGREELGQRSTSGVLGAIGGIAGSIFGGPVGGGIGKAIGSIFG